MKRLFKFLSSLKLATINIVLIALACTVATILESVFDTPTAQYWVYRSIWFYVLLTLMGVNIFSVALSRYPWKWRHGPFLTAHVGILILLGGAWSTYLRGIDGFMRLEEGQESSTVELNEKVLVLAQDIQEGEEIKSTPFVIRYPVKWIPPHIKFKTIDIPELQIRVAEFISRAEPQIDFIPTKTTLTPAIKVRIKGGPMAILQDYWLWSGQEDWKIVQAGPARLFIADLGTPIPKNKTELMAISGPWLGFFPQKNGTVFWLSKNDQSLRNGKVDFKKNKLDLGWKSGVEFSVLEYIPRADIQVRYTSARERYGNDQALSAIRLEPIGGSVQDSVWLGLGDRAGIEFEGKKIRAAYIPRRIALPFSLKLHEFKMTHDVGTLNPASYASFVSVMDKTQSDQKIWIQMNEPLEEQGYTFYQSSYEPGVPRPRVSILSVNQDPGRKYKYLGSLLIVLGSMWLFWNRMKLKKGNKA